MLQFSDLTIETAIANRSEAMETRDHFNNGASSKSLTSRCNLFMIVCAVLVCLIVVGCDTKTKKGVFMTEEGITIHIDKLGDDSYRFRAGELDAKVSFRHVSWGNIWYEGRCKDGYEFSISPERHFSEILENGVSHSSERNYIFYTSSNPNNDDTGVTLTRRIK